MVSHDRAGIGVVFSLGGGIGCAAWRIGRDFNCARAWRIASIFNGRQAVNALGATMNPKVIERRALENPWKRSELIKVAIMIFTVGMAWATLMISIRQIHNDTLMLQSRTAVIEKFLIRQSKGEFNPATEDGKQP